VGVDGAAGVQGFQVVGEAAGVDRLGQAVLLSARYQAEIGTRR
jgi:hypothetical protein